MLREGNTEHKMLVIQAVNSEEVTVLTDTRVYTIICNFHGDIAHSTYFFPCCPMPSSTLWQKS